MRLLCDHTRVPFPRVCDRVSAFAMVYSYTNLDICVSTECMNMYFRARKGDVRIALERWDNYECCYFLFLSFAG